METTNELERGVNFTSSYKGNPVRVAIIGSGRLRGLVRSQREALCEELQRKIEAVDLLKLQDQIEEIVGDLSPESKIVVSVQESPKLEKLKLDINMIDEELTINPIGYEKCLPNSKKGWKHPYKHHK